jgi:hypothetical protein
VQVGGAEVGQLTFHAHAPLSERLQIDWTGPPSHAKGEMGGTGPQSASAHAGGGGGGDAQTSDQPQVPSSRCLQTTLPGPASPHAPGAIGGTAPQSLSEHVAPLSLPRALVSSPRRTPREPHAKSAADPLAAITKKRKSVMLSPRTHALAATARFDHGAPTICAMAAL